MIGVRSSGANRPIEWLAIAIRRRLGDNKIKNSVPEFCRNLGVARGYDEKSERKYDQEKQAH